MDVKIEESWRQHIGDEFNKQYFVDLTNFVKRNTCVPLLSSGPFDFQCLQSLSFDDVKVVIIGQDPYHEPGQAMGLSFSVPTGIAFPITHQHFQGNPDGSRHSDASHGRFNPLG